LKCDIVIKIEEMVVKGEIMNRGLNLLHLMPVQQERIRKTISLAPSTMNGFDSEKEQWVMPTDVEQVARDRQREMCGHKAYNG